MKYIVAAIFFLISSCKTNKVPNIANTASTTDSITLTESTVAETATDSSVINLENLEDNGELVLKMIRGACYGTCPAYGINFYSNGLLIYNGQINVPKVGCFYTQISQSELNWLINEITAAGFFKLQEKYPLDNSAPVDLPNTTIYLKNGNQEKTVKERKWDTPVNLLDIEAIIDSFTNSKILQSCDK